MTAPATLGTVIVTQRSDAVVVGGAAPGSVVVTPQPARLPVTEVAQQGPAGPKGDKGDPGAPGAAASVSIFQITSAASLTAHHDLPFPPRVWIIDATGQEVETDIYHTSGQVTAVFPTPFTGILLLG